MRKSTVCLGLIGLQLAGFLGMLLHAAHATRQGNTRRQASKDLVRRLRLTDLCLFTEARYTRHPAMADRHAAFQDHPIGMDHFPSGSLVAPPSFPSPHANPGPPRPQHP